MGKSLRTSQTTSQQQWDWLNQSDNPRRAQKFPLVLRDVFGYLFFDGSLMARLRENTVNVQVVCTRVEQQVQTGTWFREVVIFGNGRQQWLARTIISEQCLLVLEKFFSFKMHLPLGDFLFSCDGIKRRAFDVSIVSVCPLLGTSQSRSWYWLRESIWSMGESQCDLTILEFF